jgi:hypothetical protein
MFLEDILLIAENSKLYNGPLHPLTTIATGIHDKATLMLEAVKNHFIIGKGKNLEIRERNKWENRWEK